MTFEQIITPDDGSGVAPHPHDATEVSGEATLITLRVNRLLAGMIKGKEIVIAGGTDGILRSDNFSAGSAGWQVLGDGSAEFNDVTVRGAIIAGAGSSIGFDDVTDGENVASLTIGSGGTLESSNFATGSTGWQIAGDGSAEFQNVTVRGSINADDIDAGSLDVDRIAAGTITAEKFILGSRDNLVEDPGFESGTAHPAATSSDGGATGWSISSSNPRSGGFHLLYTATGQTGSAHYDPMGFNKADNPAAGEGDAFYFAAYMAREVTGARGAVLEIVFRDENATILSTDSSSIFAITTSYVLYEHSATAPAGTAYVSFRIRPDITNNVDLLVDDLYARRMVGTTIIEDLAVTAAKIDDLAVTTAKIQDLTISEAKMGSASISTAKIQDAAITNAKINDLSADKITAGSITAREYQTASSGDALRINPGLSGESGHQIRFLRSGTLRGSVGLDFTDTILSVSGANGWGAKLGSSGSEVEAEGTTAHLLGDSGSVLIEASTGGGKMQSPSGSVAVTAYRQSTTSANDIAQFRSDHGGTNNLNAVVKVDGDLENKNNSYGGISDRRLKKNIKPARSYLDDLREVRITTHTLKATGKKLLGPIAQEVQPIFPGLVRENEDGYLSVKHSVFVPMLLTAVQELADDRDDFRTRLEALEDA